MGAHRGQCLRPRPRSSLQSETKNRENKTTLTIHHCQTYQSRFYWGTKKGPDLDRYNDPFIPPAEIKRDVEKGPKNKNVKMLKIDDNGDSRWKKNVRKVHYLLSMGTTSLATFACLLVAICAYLTFGCLCCHARLAILN